MSHIITAPVLSLALLSYVQTLAAALPGQSIEQIRSEALKQSVFLEPTFLDLGTRQELFYKAKVRALPNSAMQSMEYNVFHYGTCCSKEESITLFTYDSAFRFDRGRPDSRKTLTSIYGPSIPTDFANSKFIWQGRKYNDSNKIYLGQKFVYVSKHSLRPPGDLQYNVFVVRPRAMIENTINIWGGND